MRWDVAQPRNCLILLLILSREGFTARPGCVVFHDNTSECTIPAVGWVHGLLISNPCVRGARGSIESLFHLIQDREHPFRFNLLQRQNRHRPAVVVEAEGQLINQTISFTFHFDSRDSRYKIVETHKTLLRIFGDCHISVPAYPRPLFRHGDSGFEAACSVHQTVVNRVGTRPDTSLSDLFYLIAGAPLPEATLSTKLA